MQSSRKSILCRAQSSPSPSSIWSKARARSDSVKKSIIEPLRTEMEYNARMDIEKIKKDIETLKEWINFSSTKKDEGYVTDSDNDYDTRSFR